MPLALAEQWIPAEPDVMEITGRLDGGTAAIVEEDAMLCIQSGARRMVLDCGALTYISGAGLRVILTLARAMQNAGGRLAVCDLQPQAEEIFNLSGFNIIIPVFGSRDEAILAFAD